jgi:hypothetical protein
VSLLKPSGLREVDGAAVFDGAVLMLADLRPNAVK